MIAALLWFIASCVLVLVGIILGVGITGLILAVTEEVEITTGSLDELGEIWRRES